MVTTRNRYKNGLGSPTPLPLPALPKSRRPRQTKSKNRPSQEEESETVESSSPTPTPDSASPSPNTTTPPHGLFNDKLEYNHLHQGVHSSDDEHELEHDTLNINTETKYNAVIESNGEKSNSSHTEEGSDDDDNDDDERSDEEEEQTEEPNLSEDKDDDDDEDDDEDDLNQLLAKAQASLKRKAMFEEKSEEPRFNFPKLETGLNTKNVYIKQHGTQAKVDVNAVAVVDKSKPTPKSSKQATLETCEVKMGEEKVHLSKKQKKEEREKTAGKGWFDLPQQVLTPELKRDLQILKLRNVLDPKRFYKREEKGKPKFPKYFQVGTIIQGNTEFYSSRLTKKERATTITGEVMKDITGRDYYKRKFNEIQESKQSGGKRFNKKGKGKQSKSWRAGKK
ncbi:hypothetical protein BGZ76_011273 [Entomortierella beljakovae]|nr:hypothetical protein BGZ76_011273 [Entomortierella beljakovae]